MISCLKEVFVAKCSNVMSDLEKPLSKFKILNKGVTKQLQQFENKIWQNLVHCDLLCLVVCVNTSHENIRHSQRISSCCPLRGVHSSHAPSLEKHYEQQASYPFLVNWNERDSLIFYPAMNDLLHQRPKIPISSVFYKSNSIVQFKIIHVVVKDSG